MKWHSKESFVNVNSSVIRNTRIVKLIKLKDTNYDKTVQKIHAMPKINKLQIMIFYGTYAVTTSHAMFFYDKHFNRKSSKISVS